MEAEHVGFVHGIGIDALLLRDETHRLDAVADARCLLVVELAGSRLHLRRKLGLDRLAFSREEPFRLAHQLVVSFGRHKSHARGRAALDLVQQAGPRSILKNTVVTRS